MATVTSIREELEAREAATLSPHAALARNSRGRRTPEPQDPVRTCFQRDRDRIVHSKAFRRLMHKTQVFLSPLGDHYRTRLTHSIEVMQLSRSIARGCNLNEDLAEAIALGHDLGHSPFGHAGEAALTEVLGRYEPGTRFIHSEQSLRVVMYLERRGDKIGLNLTEEVLDGIAKHSKHGGALAGHTDIPATLEGQIVRYCDRLAYINHDIDDALRAGVIREDDLPRQAIDVLGSRGSVRIETVVQDVIEQCRGRNEIKLSQPVLDAVETIKTFMFEHVYLNEDAKTEEPKAQNVVRRLFEYYMEHPAELPEEFARGAQPGDSLARRVCDYIAGFTDRFAIAKFKELFLDSVVAEIPREWDV
ncbi:MAG: deoxyguanosinetriphosphate triphosphohydrolase [Candidatus Eremiobacteraeota bacterium]|nr:deoxyguanosinetriphosphate triphosphohydrolase [Candidatus Eremiobacteraeota bacterium]MBV8460048.1 deoxyguanosinetriphosphate triphosphohydrolase [Candidatus Eremiobacteraeota bacterium]MBV8595548.1 deoxyguanosinetriphosphate triphosphohydrolase [Candidatus Eremiobacteraeota bacterium]